MVRVTKNTHEIQKKDLFATANQSLRNDHKKPIINKMKCDIQAKF